MIRYCSKCVIPSTRPNITFDREGVCNACRAHESKVEVDWKARESEFRSIVEKVKAHSGGYDCLIPVSGGKDSTWQVVECLRYGLTPLAVTWKSPARTPIGARNLANLVRLGVDHIDYQINPKIERVFMLEAFRRYGSTAIPMHMAIFSIPLRVASGFKIPLIVWGENSAIEYGGSKGDFGFKLDRAWFKKFGVTHGTTSEDWVSDLLPKKKLAGYETPTENALVNTMGIFLGYFFPWDAETSLRVAKEHGFEVDTHGPRTGVYNYADIDDDFISIHHYLKWYKFGFTRTYDNLSLEIRNGRMTRAEAVEKIRQRGDETPSSDITTLCSFLEISEEEFYRIAETFRNRDVWTLEGGVWKIPGFLIPEWKWSRGAH